MSVAQSVADIIIIIIIIINKVLIKVTLNKVIAAGHFTLYTVSG